LKQHTNSANFVKIAQIIRSSGIPKFGNISVKCSVFEVPYPYLCIDGGEIWHILRGGVDL